MSTLMATNVEWQPAPEQSSKVNLVTLKRLPERFPCGMPGGQGWDGLWTRMISLCLGCREENPKAERSPRTNFVARPSLRVRVSRLFSFERSSSQIPAQHPWAPKASFGTASLTSRAVEQDTLPCQETLLLLLLLSPSILLFLHWTRLNWLIFIRTHSPCPFLICTYTTTLGEINLGESN